MTYRVVQTKKVNKVFKALDGKQAQQALVAKAPPENRVRLQGKDGEFTGIQVSELSSDQKGLVEESEAVCGCWSLKAVSHYLLFLRQT